MRYHKLYSNPFPELAERWLRERAEQLGVTAERRGDKLVLIGVRYHDAPISGTPYRPTVDGVEYSIGALYYFVPDAEFSPQELRKSEIEELALSLFS